MTPLQPTAFPLSIGTVVGVLVVISVAYQLNARVTPWADWTARADGQYLRSWWSYVVLNGASAALVVGLVLWGGGTLETLGLVVPRPLNAAALLALYLGICLAYYRGVVRAPTLDERALERAGDGWTPATRRQRVLGYLTLSFSPGLFEEIVYRGFAVTAFVAYGFSSWVAIAFATVPYVLLHGRGAFVSAESFLRYVALGIAFGWIYVSTGSLWVAVVAHAGWNLAVTIRDTRRYLAGGDSSTRVVA